MKVILLGNLSNLSFGQYGHSRIGGFQIAQYLTKADAQVIIKLAVFSWSIFIRSVIDHMTCYNLKWTKIKL